MTDVSNLRHTIVPKSDQLNAEQLLGGDMVITVTGVALSTSPDQPVTIHYDGENGRPFKPCKTMRKLLIAIWGEDGNQWVGRAMRLWCDPEVKWAGEKVGGIRIKALSHMQAASADVSLTETRGKKRTYRVARLESQVKPVIQQDAKQPIMDESKILAALSLAANDGSDALREEWTGLNPAQKKLAGGADTLEKLKSIAAKADAQQQPDEPEF